MFDIPCIIFAGGKSSRMGEDKALLPFAGFNTLSEYQYSKLSKIFKNVYISCKDKSKFDFVANFIEDETDIDIFAPTVGFITAFKKLKSEKIFVISVDTPFISYEEIKMIYNNDTQSYDATIAQTDNGIQPLCGIYHNSLIASFTTMIQTNEHKLGFMLKNANTKYIYFNDAKPFLNLNHPHEYQEAIRIIQNY